MSRRGSGNNKRREVLKALGTGLGAIGISSQTVTADDGVLEEPEVAELLEAAGRPGVDALNTDSFSIQGHTYYKTEIQTETGTLVYSKPPSAISLNSSYEEPAAIFLFEELTGRTRQQLPDRFQTLPPNLELGLFYEEGEVVARRSVTIRERRKLGAIAETSLTDHDGTPIYDEGEGIYVFPRSEDELVFVEIEGIHAAENISESFQTLRSGAYTVTILEDSLDDDASSSPSLLSYHEWQGGSCFGGWGSPCVQCVFGGGICGICTGVCTISGGWGCVACIATCAGTGGTCGCCLSCVDDLHHPWCY